MDGEPADDGHGLEKDEKSKHSMEPIRPSSLPYESAAECDELRELRSKLDETERKLKLKGDAMTYAAMRYQVDVAALQSQNSKLASRCDEESGAKQQLQKSAESLKSSVTAVSAELLRKDEQITYLEKCLNEERKAWSASVAEKRRELMTANENRLESLDRC